MTSPPPFDPAKFGRYDSQIEARMVSLLGELYWSIEPDWGEFTQDGEWVDLIEGGE